MKLLFIGDIVGSSGREALEQHLPSLREEYNWDLCIANGENAAGGRGITEQIAHDLMDLGVNLITMGNHTWDNKDILNFIDEADFMLRPLNYPLETPGRGWVTLMVGNKRVGVINLEGQAFMGPLDCPFAAADRAIQAMQDCEYIIVDMHAEATAEKLAMAWYLDGRVSAVIGTHTHIQTSDERRLPGGTLYITDAGMTGAIDSVLGMEIRPVLERFTTKLPRRFSAAKGRGMVNAVFCDLDQGIIKRVDIR